MSRDVLTVTPRAPLTRVLQKMLDSGSRSFPVVDGERLVGVVAREDLLGALRRGVAGERPWARRATGSGTGAAKRRSSGRKRTRG
jgi:CBS domain-containing protein